MASSINASTSAGVITTADTSGVLNIQTAGTTAISIDASQAVSFTNPITGALNGTIGATTPATGAFTTVQIGTNPAGVSIGVLGIPNQKRIYGRNAANSADVNILYVNGSNGLVFGPSDAATIDSSGNLGIGTSSPNIAGVATALTVNGTDAILEVANGGTLRASVYGNASGGAFSGVGSSGIRFFTSASGATTLAVTIDTAQNLLVGTTTVAGSAKLTVNGDIATSGTGTGSRLRNQIDGVSVSTSATTIIVAGDIGQLVVINGISGSDRFCDLVMSSTGANPVVVQSFTALGSPAARTYTRSGSNLQLAMASGTYTVRALSLGS
jgi:hypothetical protein